MILTRTLSRAVFLPHLMLCLRSDSLQDVSCWKVPLWAAWRLCCVQDMPWVSQPQPAQGSCLPSAAGRFVPGVRSQKLLCALCHKPAQQWGSEDSVTGVAIRCKDMCPVSRAADFRGDAGLRNPPDRAGVSEHHQGLRCRPVLTMARKLYSYAPHLHCASKTLILQGDVGAEILVWDSSGKWLRKEIEAYPELFHSRIWGHLWEMMWWWPHLSQGSCTCQGRCGWG